MSRFRRRISIDFAAINREALGCLPAVFAASCPTAGARATNMSRSTRVAATATWARSRSICRTGRWADFATDDKGGDPVSLVAFIEDCKQGEAALKLARMLGLDGGGRRHG